MVVESPASRSSGNTQNSDKLESTDEVVDVTIGGHKWVSLREFAIIVGIAYQTACRYRDEGKVLTVKIGGRYRVYVEELQRFQNEGNREL